MKPRHTLTNRPDPKREAERAEIAALTAAFLAGGGKIDHRGHGETGVLNGKKQTVADRARAHAGVVKNQPRRGGKRRIVMESL